MKFIAYLIGISLLLSIWYWIGLQHKKKIKPEKILLQNPVIGDGNYRPYIQLIGAWTVFPSA